MQGREMDVGLAFEGLCKSLDRGTRVDEGGEGTERDTGLGVVLERAGRRRKEARELAEAHAAMVAHRRCTQRRSCDGGSGDYGREGEEEVVHDCRWRTRREGGGVCGPCGGMAHCKGRCWVRWHWLCVTGRRMVVALRGLVGGREAQKREARRSGAAWRRLEEAEGVWLVVHKGRWAGRKLEDEMMKNMMMLMGRCRGDGGQVEGRRIGISFRV